VAGLLAIAIFGVALAAAFDARVRPGLDRLSLSAAARQEVDGELRKIAGADVSNSASLAPSQRRDVRALVENGFVGAFRLVMLSAAGLALLAAGFGFAMAPERPSARKTRSNLRD
jgi:hypothetical protein